MEAGTYLVSISTPALAHALGTTKPEPVSAYTVVILRNAAPVNNAKNVCVIDRSKLTLSPSNSLYQDQTGSHATSS